MDAIGEVVRRYDALDRFNWMIGQWAVVGEKWLAEATDYRNRRHEHTARVIHDAALQAKENGPPGWYFEPLLALENGVTLWAWVPPDLSADNEPNARFPLPVPDGEVYVFEKYAGLAAIHTHDLKGEKLNPWNGSEEGLRYRHTLVSLVESLPESDEADLWEWLKDVEEDIRAVKPVDFPPITKTPEHLKDAGLRDLKAAPLDDEGGSSPDDARLDDPVAAAVGLKANDPTLTARAVAKQVGVAHTTVTRDDRWKNLVRLQAHDPPPKGSKRKDGGIEASDE